VYLGLQLVLAKAKKDQNDEFATSIVDIIEACSTSIEILNELLLYDKIEDGKMLLEKKHANAMETLTSAIKPFVMQVYTYILHIVHLHIYAVVVDTKYY
jgi:hypothetical protein